MPAKQSRPEKRARHPETTGAAISADQVRKGLPMRALDELAERLKVERAALALILGTSVRTLQRKEEGSERLGPAASDRLARISRILDLAFHVFGEHDKASIWLTSRSRALEGEIPLEMLDTDIGTQRVQQELRQIEFGMPF
jgi:putative toxin-antitoxin system antitoxin component (TIGR02293 family)